MADPAPLSAALQALPIPAKAAELAAAKERLTELSRVHGRTPSAELADALYYQIHTIAALEGELQWLKTHPGQNLPAAP